MDLSDVGTLEGTTVPTPDEGGRTLRWMTWVLLGLIAVGVSLLVVKVLTWDWWAVGDFGIIRLRTLDVGTGATPLVGPYSRWGWNHPGPLMFYVFAGPLRLLGGDGHGLLLGALVVNVLAIGAAVWMALRVGRDVFAWVTIVLALLVVGLDPGELLDPWNPFVLVVAMFTAAVASWLAATGDRVAAVGVVVAASVAVQSHIGAAPAIAALGAVAVVGLVVRVVRGSDRRDAVITILVAVGVALLCWAAPLWQQLTGHPGNLGEIVDYVLHNKEAVNGWADGFQRVSQALSLPPIWVTGDLQSANVDHPVPWALVAVVLAAAWAAWRRWWRELVACGTAVAFVVGALVASSEVSGAPFPYLFRWLWAVGAFTWFAAGLVVLAELRRHAWRRYTEAALLVVGSLLVLGLIVAGPDTSALESSDQALRTFERLIAPTEEALRSVPGPTLISAPDNAIDGSMGIELLARAGEDGLDVRYPDDAAFVVGSSRTIDPADARSELVLAASAATVARLDADPRYRLVASYDPLSPDERAEYERLSAIDWSTRPDGWADPGPEFRRLMELSENFQTLSVYISDQPPVDG